MVRLQKHERETLKLLREHGYTVDIQRTGHGHSDIFVTRGGVTKRLHLLSSPAVKATYPARVLARCNRYFKENQ